MDKKVLCDLIDAKAPFLNDLSDRIWDSPELAFAEKNSAEILVRALLAEGFEVTRGVADIETAFLGRYGCGKPMIGILGEFDALTGRHSWQVVAQGKSELAHKSTLYAGKVIAGAAVDLLENPELIEKAKAEKLKKLGGAPYICPIPKGVVPRAMG